jgi:hypothetical protein
VDVSAGYSRDHINYKERRAQWRKLETQLVGTVAEKSPPLRII